MDEMVLRAGYASVEVTQSSNTSSTTMTTTTVSAAEDAQEPDDERKIINELLSRLEPPVVRRLWTILTCVRFAETKTFVLTFTVADRCC